MQVYLRIYGRVQGVLFRHTAKRKADDLGLVGWAKNNDDGSVEIVVIGSKDKLEKFLAWCKKGPPMAKVEKVEVEWLSENQDFDRFDTV